MIPTTMEYRDQHECSLQEAKRAVAKLHKLDRLNSLRHRCFRVRDGDSVASILGDFIDEYISEVDQS